MNERPLFDNDDRSPVVTPKELARRTDPETSHQAAAAIAAAVPELCEWAAACVRESPGLTQRELGAKYCPDDLRKIGRRLGEAADRGLVRRGETRACSITGKKAQTWWPPEG